MIYINHIVLYIYALGGHCGYYFVFAGKVFVNAEYKFLQSATLKDLCMSFTFWYFVAWFPLALLHYGG